MYYNTLGFHMNAKCYCNCEMCILSCEANSNQFLPRELIFDFIQQATKQKYVHHIAFSGGDPFLQYDDLVSSIQYARSLEFETSCYTNAFWCNDFSETVKKVRELERAGLQTMRISIDYQHSKTVPIERYRFLLQALRETKISVYINAGILKDDEDFTFKVLDDLKNSLFYYNIVIFPFMKIGRAERLPKEKFYCEIGKSDLKCPRNTILAIRVNGNVYACDMSPDNLNCVGNAFEHSLHYLISSAKRDKYHRLVQRRGLQWIVREIENRGVDIVPKEFASPCEFCKWIGDRHDILNMLLEGQGI